MKDIKLGARARDIVSGFTGIVTARTEFLNGCVRYSIDPEKLDKGQVIEGRWFDAQQVELVTDKTPAAALATAARATGGTRPDARRRSDATRRGDAKRR